MKKVISVGAVLVCVIGLTTSATAQSLGLPRTQVNSTETNLSSPTQPDPIKLLNAGVGDRRPLRFKPSVGTRSLNLMKFDQAISILLSGKPLPAVAAPSTVATIETTITDVAANGDISYQFRYSNVDVVTKPGVQPAVVERMRSQLKIMQGLRGSFVMNDRGQILSARFELPDQLDPLTQRLVEQIPQSAYQFSAPLPEEPVGVGAKWQVSRPFTLNGITLTQTGIYELVNFKGNSATLKVAIEQQAQPQQVAFPGTSPDVQARLKSLKSQGSGQSVVDLSKAFVHSATLSLRSTFQIEATSSKLPQRFDTTTQLSADVTIQPK